jgi:hypothetical protein
MSEFHRILQNLQLEREVDGVIELIDLRAEDVYFVRDITVARVCPSEFSNIAIYGTQAGFFDGTLIFDLFPQLDYFLLSYFNSKFSISFFENKFPQTLEMGKDAQVAKEPMELSPSENDVGMDNLGNKLSLPGLALKTELVKSVNVGSAHKSTYFCSKSHLEDLKKSVMSQSTDVSTLAFKNALKDLISFSVVCKGLQDSNAIAMYIDGLKVLPPAYDSSLLAELIFDVQETKYMASHLVPEFMAVERILGSTLDRVDKQIDKVFDVVKQMNTEFNQTARYTVKEVNETIRLTIEKILHATLAICVVICVFMICFICYLFKK